MKEHTIVNDAAVPATCTEAGKTAGTHCSVCNTVLTAQTAVPAKGHTIVNDAAVPATCTEAGKTAGTHCSVCNTVLTAQTAVPAKGHTETSADNGIAATCTAERVCDCGEKETEKSTATSKTTATYFAKGKTTYTAKFKNTAFKKQTKTVAEAKKTLANVKSLKVSKKTKTSLTLKWSKNSDATGYEIQQMVGKKWKTVKTISKNKTVTLKISKLKKNTSYKFRVRAYKKVGKTKVYGAYASITGKTKK